jgi:hypothetical protein
VKDLPENFVQLRKQVLSNASYLAALPEAELGTLPPTAHSPQATKPKTKTKTNTHQNPWKARNPST